MSQGDFNQALWAVQNDAGWWFWLPFAIYGGIGLYHLYGLAAPVSGLGRLIRVLLTTGYVSMVFSPAFNGLGGYAFHLLAIASVLMVGQQYVLCKRQGRIKPPESPHFVGRLVERMADNQRSKT